MYKLKIITSYIMLIMTLSLTACATPPKPLSSDGFPKVAINTPQTSDVIAMCSRSKERGDSQKTRWCRSHAL